MKKAFITLFIIFGIYYVIGVTTAKSFEIPDEAIRIRVLANSDSEYDQKIKKEVSKKVEKYLSGILKDTKGIDDARKKINHNLKEIDSIVDNVFTQNNYKLKHSINFGINYFPSKEFKGVKYNEGYYESLLITLGEGKGSNWWCVLFPPLCLIEADESSDVEYSSFVKEIVEKYL